MNLRFATALLLGSDLSMKTKVTQFHEANEIRLRREVRKGTDISRKDYPGMQLETLDSLIGFDEYSGKLQELILCHWTSNLYQSRLTQLPCESSDERFVDYFVWETCKRLFQVSAKE